MQCSSGLSMVNCLFLKPILLSIFGRMVNASGTFTNYFIRLKRKHFFSLVPYPAIKDTKFSPRGCPQLWQWTHPQQNFKVLGVPSTEDHNRCVSTFNVNAF